MPARASRPGYAVATRTGTGTLDGCTPAHSRAGADLAPFTVPDDETHDVIARLAHVETGAPVVLRRLAVTIATRAPVRARTFVAFPAGDGPALDITRIVGPVFVCLFVIGAGVTVPSPVPVLAASAVPRPLTVRLPAADQLPATAVAIRRRTGDDHPHTRAAATDRRVELDEHEHALEPLSLYSAITSRIDAFHRSNASPLFASISRAARAHRSPAHRRHSPRKLISASGVPAVPQSLHAFGRIPRPFAITLPVYATGGGGVAQTTRDPVRLGR